MSKRAVAVGEAQLSKVGPYDLRSFLMPTYARIIFAALILAAASANTVSIASASDGLQQACQSGSLTPHGYLDCH